MYLYLASFVLSAVLGYLFSKNIIDKKNTSSVSKFIRYFSTIGVGLVVFGILYLLSNIFIPKFNNSNQWEIREKIELNSTNPDKLVYLKREKKENFDTNTLSFDEEVLSTATLIFTIAGVLLGTLGIFWLAHLEMTRLENDRNHDQKKQNDRLLSLLSLGIDLFLHIDKQELDFMYDTEKEDICQKTENIKWQNRYYFRLTSDITDDKLLKKEYEKHLVSLYKFLYEHKNLQKNTILEEIYKIIEELQLLYYEKDLILYGENEKRKRELFIGLLRGYNNYKNFIKGYTVESDFGISEYQVFDKKLSTLLSTSSKKTEHNPIRYLYKIYKDKDKDHETLFYDYFLSSRLQEFTEIYLIQESNIFSTFESVYVKDIFEIMSISNLKPDRFFKAYFKGSFTKYISDKKAYKDTDLKIDDFSFDEYLGVFYDTFKQMEADIKSVKELYGLFGSFVKLHKEFSENGGKDG